MIHHPHIEGELSTPHLGDKSSSRIPNPWCSLIYIWPPRKFVLQIYIWAWFLYPRKFKLQLWLNHTIEPYKNILQHLRLQTLKHTLQANSCKFSSTLWKEDLLGWRWRNLENSGQTRASRVWVINTLKIIIHYPSSTTIHVQHKKCHPKCNDFKYHTTLNIIFSIHI